MSAKNYFKDGGRWIKGKLVVGEKAFCIYNAQCTKHRSGGIIFFYYKSMKSRMFRPILQVIIFIYL